MPSGILTCCTGPFRSDSLCLFGFSLPSLRCLLSALTQAGGGDLLGSLVQFSPTTGRAGAADRYRYVWIALPVFRPHWVCPVQGVCAFPVYTAQAPGCSIWSGPCVESGSSFWVLHKSADLVVPAFCVFPGLSDPGSQRLGRSFPGCGAPCPSAASAPGSQRLGPPLPDAARLFPLRPQRAPPVGSQEFFR